MREETEAETDNVWEAAEHISLQERCELLRHRAEAGRGGGGHVQVGFRNQS